jgi:predicted transposase/invertase (TIGR01784 family)
MILAAASSRDKGKAEGRIEGEIEKSRQITTKLKMKGIDPELIAECTNLTIEEIERL